MFKPILIACSVLLILPNLFKTDINATAYASPAYDHKERFDPALSRLNTIDKLDAYIEENVKAKNITPGSLEYVKEIKNAISYRFYHGFSHQALNENWVAAGAEKLFGYGLSCNVTPQEIIKHPNAACSQQCIVMMEILRRKKIDFRSVGFPHHYAIEVKVNSSWYYFDPNMEPSIPDNERLESNWKCCADNLKKYYDTARFKDLDEKFGIGAIVTLGKINERPAKNARAFQAITGYASKLLWCVPLLILLYRRRITLPKFKAPVIHLLHGGRHPQLSA